MPQPIASFRADIAAQHFVPVLRDLSVTISQPFPERIPTGVGVVLPIRCHGPSSSTSHGKHLLGKLVQSQFTSPVSDATVVR